MNPIPTILRKKTNKQGKVNIKIRIVHNRKVRDIATEFYIDPDFWTASGHVHDDYPKADYINFELSKKMLDYQGRLLGINIKDMHINRVVEILRQESFTPSSFSSYFGSVVVEKAKINPRTSQIFQVTLNKIVSYDNRSPLMFEDINAGWLRKFETWMIHDGLKTSSISIHLRNIRTVFNHAIDDNVASLSLYPFRRFKIKAGTSERTPLTLKQLQNLISLPLEFPYQQNARNVWLLSFCLIGINNSDLFDAKAKSIVSERLVYSRNKTAKGYSIKVEPEAMQLIKELAGKSALLNLADRFKDVRVFTTSTNILLKEIGAKIGKPNLIMYDARHTWASMAKNLLGTDDNDISAALGHSIAGVTQLYIHRSHDSVDKINRNILDKVFQVKKQVKTKQKKEAEAS